MLLPYCRCRVEVNYVLVNLNQEVRTHGEPTDYKQITLTLHIAGNRDVIIKTIKANVTPRRLYVP